MLFPQRFYFLRLNLTGFVAKAATDVRQHIGELLISEKVVGGHDVIIRFTVDLLPLQAFQQDIDEPRFVARHPIDTAQGRV